MQSRKGVLEVGGVIYPVAIKVWCIKFGDALEQLGEWYGELPVQDDDELGHRGRLWYLPPMYMEEEDAITFAEPREARSCPEGVVGRPRLGRQPKRQQVKSEWKAAQQQQFQENQSWLNAAQQQSKRDK